MKLGSSLAVSTLTLVAAGVLPGACGMDGLVGGTCRTNLTNCDNRCVNLDSDANNCGRCGRRCEPGVNCIHRTCGGGGEAGYGQDPNGGSGNHGRDGGSGDSGTDPDAQADAFGEFDVVYPGGGGGTAGAGNATQGGASNGGGGGAAGSGGNAGAAGGTGDVCVAPFNTAAHCGDCETVCVEPTRVCAPIEGKYACVPFCDAPLVECNGACVDLNSDSDNCGQCNRACPSAICQGGSCIGAQAGHIVPICMNFNEAAQTSQSTSLLGNAVFLPLFNPVKILAYDEFAAQGPRSRVDLAIGWASAARGRGYRITSISQPEAVNVQLKKPDFDVFLVYEQSLAPPGTLSSYGSQWAKALESFSYVGGVIVVLDGAAGTNEMAPFLTSARLLEVSGEDSVSRQQVYNRAPADALGINVVSPFLALRDSCVFSTPTPSDSTTVFVVTDEPTAGGSRRPVAVHRIAIPPVQ